MKNLIEFLYLFFFLPIHLPLHTCKAIESRQWNEGKNQRIFFFASFVKQILTHMCGTDSIHLRKRSMCMGNFQYY